jgi:RecB family exonuclease
VALVAERAGVAGRPLGPVARERIVRAAVADVELDRLAPSSASPGFAAAAGRLFAELQRSLVPAPRFAEAMRRWGETAGQAGYAAEVAGLYTAYARRLERLGRRDAEGFAWAALDALRADPASWPGRPVFLYGFDDLTPTELDAIDALAHAAGADVTVALPFEAGRAAFAGRAATVETLRPLAREHVELRERSEHYAAAARPALHHLERGLFEAGRRPQPPNGAIRLLESGGERAEAELVGAAILELMERGVGPGDIAVLFRSPDDAIPLAEAVLEAYGIPVAHDRPVPLGRTRLGSGLEAFARVALGAGEAADLLTWLRTPGKLRVPELADALEVRVRREQVSGAGEARRLWEADRWPLAELDGLAAAAAAGDVDGVLEALERELETIWTAPHRRAAAILGPAEQVDARVAAEVRGALAELRSLRRRDPGLVPGADAVVEALAGLRVRDRAAGAGGVLLSDPLAIRARRFRAVFVCGLQDGAFPLRPGPEPFLDDDERRALARASGVRLRLHEDVVDRERFLFYTCTSRPEEVLYLSWRSSDEEGNPLQASTFVDDVRTLFTEELHEGRGRRLLADVTWPPALAPTPTELRRAAAAAAPAQDDPPALAAPVSVPVLAVLAGRERESARGLESFAACGVRWLVESLMRPERIEPDPEPMQRGSLAHAVLERTLRGLRERTGSARLSEARLPEAEAELTTALRELAGTPAGARARAALRGLEVDLRRVLRAEAQVGSELEPDQLEWSFGGARDADGPLVLDGGAIEVTGRVDRIDRGPGGRAVVRDYKNRTVYAGARWAEDGRLQVALYALAARELLGLQPVGAVYQPLGGPDLRPRGLVCDDGEGRWVATDVVDEERFACALDEAREAAERAARDLRAGRIVACPSACTPKGCAYPAICRATP